MTIKDDKIAPCTNAQAIASRFCIFAATSLWFIKSASHRRRRRGYNKVPRQIVHAGTVITRHSCMSDQDEDSDSDANSNSSDCEYHGSGGMAAGRASMRGVQALTPVKSYLQSFFQCLQNPCDPMHNPTGFIGLCVAENKLVQETLARRLMNQGTAVVAFADSVVYSYNGFLGLPHVREAMAYFMEKSFLLGGGGHGKDRLLENRGSEHSGDSSPLSSTTSASLDENRNNQFGRIDPENVALGSGAGSLLNHLFFSLAERGDVVLIPAPYYAAFDNDMKVIAGLIPFPVYMNNALRGPSIIDLDVSYKKAQREGLRCKVLLLTNPNNPLGVYYRPNVMRQCVDWARSKNMHTIVDEVYGLSVHQIVSEEFNGDNNNGHRMFGERRMYETAVLDQRQPFQSIIQVMNNEMGHDVHMVWALSKDFGACGFRVGVLYTQNKLLLQSLANLNIFSGVSHPIQMIVAEILTDDEFVDGFLNDMRMQLRYSYEICALKLDEMVVPYVPAEAGIFVYADFSALLPSPTFDGEAQFAKLVEDYARVVMTPGQTQKDNRPGMFRICYAWVSPEVLEIAMERISRLVVKIRKMSWADLNQDCLGDIIRSSNNTSRRASFSFS